jgi:hypothetical protein
MDKEDWLFQLLIRSRVRFVEDFPNLSEPEQLFVSILELDGEVNNGGFVQYYQNWSGDKALRLPSMLRTIGANNLARTVAEANAVFGPAGPPKDQEERCRIIDSFIDSFTSAALGKFDELSKQFAVYPDNLFDKLYDYVQEHRSEFKDL